jgi:hypothetical protein
MARDDIRARPGADAYIVVEDIKVAPGHRKATLRACFWDTGVIYDRRGTDDPSDDVIFDDVPIAMRSTYELDLTDKGWLRSSNHDTTKQPWENLCGPAPA